MSRFQKNQRIYQSPLFHSALAPQPCQFRYYWKLLILIYEYNVNVSIFNGIHISFILRRNIVGDGNCNRIFRDIHMCAFNFNGMYFFFNIKIFTVETYQFHLLAMVGFKIGFRTWGSSFLIFSFNVCYIIILDKINIYLAMMFESNVVIWKIKKDIQIFS